MFLPNGESGANSLFKERLIYFDTFGRKHADVNLGPRVIESNAQKSLPMVLHLDQFAVDGRLCKTKNRAVINPGMTGKDPICFTGF